MRRHAIATLAVLALAAGACTRAEGDTEVGAAVATADPGTGQAGGDAGGGNASGNRLDQGGFGDLEHVCAEGEPGHATEVGLTTDEIRLGTITDKGSAERPGLTQEVYDSAVAFAAWCNEHGGIGGRQVVIDDLDARLFEYGQRIGEACRLLVRLGTVGLATGLGFGVAAWFIAHGTRNPLQQRDAIVVALLGLTIAVVGGALFVKGAVAGFLRFWMARLCYEQQAQADRIAASLASGNGRDPAAAAPAVEQPDPAQG